MYCYLFSLLSRFSLLLVLLFELREASEPAVKGNLQIKSFFSLTFSLCFIIYSFLFVQDDGAIYNMDEYDPAEDSKIEGETSNVDDSTTHEDSMVEETGVSEAPLVEEEMEKADETEEEVEKSLLQEDGEEQEEEESQDVGQEEEQLLMTPPDEKVQVLPLTGVLCRTCQWKVNRSCINLNFCYCNQHSASFKSI